MCTSIVEIAAAEGMAKREDDWFPITHSVVAYDHARHAVGVGPRSFRLALRPLQLRGRHHLHRLGDLLRALHAGDAVAEVLEARHGAIRP